MAFPALKKLLASDRVLNQVQENVAQALKPLLESSIGSGRVIDSIAIVSGTPKTVEHKLGREFKGWIVVRKNADANVWESTSSIPSKTLILNADANVTISIWIF